MNFNQAYNYLLSMSNLPKEQYMGSTKKHNRYLKRLQFFLDILGNPEKQIPHYIHITGTSGKGSVTNMIHSMLHESGYKVASNISPAPKSVTHRWRIGNKYMSQKTFARIVSEFECKLDKYISSSPYGMLSFFDISTAMSLYWFAEAKVDYAILEVGCGGEFDSTNVIPHKDVAIITNIGLDHVPMLGNTKEDIAKTKAGIIKKGSAVFTTEKNKKLLEIFEQKSKKEKAKSFKAIKNTAKFLKQNIHGQSFSYKEQEYFLPVHGEHQITNACLAIQVAEFLLLKKSAIKRGLANASFPLRMQIVSEKPLIILDGAHNKDKIKTTVRTLEEIRKQEKKKDLHLLLGFSGDKNLSAMLKELMKLKPKSVAITRNTANAFRPVYDPKKLQKYFDKAGIQNKIFLNPKTAFEWSKNKCKKDDILLATGSIYLSGELL